MLKKLIISFLFILFVSCAFAGDPDTNYVQLFKNKVALKTFLSNSEYGFSFAPRNNSAYSAEELKNTRVVFSANNPPILGVSINIKGITAGYSFTMNSMDNTARQRSYLNTVRMSIYGFAFGFEGIYQECKRYYFRFNNDTIQSKNYNPDLLDWKIGANGIFIFNGSKFSYNAAFNQSQIQKKSAKSFLLFMGLGVNKLVNKNDPILPAPIRPYFDGGTVYNYSNAKSLQTFSFFLQPGYGFNLTKYHFYFAAAAFGGAGIQTKIYRPNPYHRPPAFGPSLIYRGKVSIGYNGKALYTGVYGNFDENICYYRRLKFKETEYSYGVYFGLRAIKYTKSKGQLKQEAKRKKLAEKEAAKKEKENKQKAAETKKKKK